MSVVTRAVDPQAVGEWLAEARRDYPRVPLSQIADRIPWDAMPEIDKTWTSVTESVAAYQYELQERAVKGDRFAISVLEHGEPGDTAD